MATTPTVNNPTNARPYLGQPIPFTTPKHIAALAKEREKKDPFNTGKDYPDEGAPLFTSDVLIAKAPIKPAFAIVPGIVNAPSKAEVDAITNIDKVAQGEHIRYFREAVVMDIDAKLIVSTMNQMKQGIFREAHYPTLQDYLKSPHYRQLRESKIVLDNLVGISQKTRLREGGQPTIAGIRLNPRLVHSFQRVDNYIIKRLKESGFEKEVKKLREQGGFPGDIGDFGSVGAAGEVLSNWDGGQSFALAGRVPDFIPMIGGPYNKQLYFADYLDMHSKAFEAWTHNPVAKRIVKVIRQFVLGKGVKVSVMSAERKTGQKTTNPQTGETVDIYEDHKEKCQQKLDEHWMKNNLHIRSKQILGDLIIFGEQFVRYFDAPWGLKIRQLDPSTVWEVITDPDDAENEFYLHQQYPTRYQWYVDLPIPTIKFIIRQVPALLYYHMKINTVAGEVRGRSELFAILGWLKRLKEYASDRVIRNKMGNLFVLDVAVEGDATAVEAVRQQFATPPTPGSFFIHNKAAEMTGIRAEIGASDTQGDWEMLLTVISMGAGLSQSYLGMSGLGGKAEALVGTEPDIKTFEDYQELMEAFFLQDSQRVFQRCMERKEIPNDLSISVEVTYPALAEENRSEKLKDLAFGESMSWWGHRRVANAAAKEMQFTSYDYDAEQEDIAKEDAQKEYQINAAYKQVMKGTDSAKAGGEESASGMGRAMTSIREAEDEDDEGIPATAPGTSAGSRVSGMATTHNASKGANGKIDPWAGDPRDMAEKIKREAANLRYDRRGIGRRQDRVQTPDKIRDQRLLDRGEILTKAKRAMHRGNLNKESRPIMRFPRLKASMEPFKPQDGDKLQRPRVETVPDHQGHPRSSGKKMSPRSFADHKKT